MINLIFLVNRLVDKTDAFVIRLDACEHKCEIDHAQDEDSGETWKNDEEAYLDFVDFANLILDEIDAYTPQLELLESEHGEEDGASRPTATAGGNEKWVPASDKITAADVAQVADHVVGKFNAFRARVDVLEGVQGSTAVTHNVNRPGFPGGHLVRNA